MEGRSLRWFLCTLTCLSVSWKAVLFVVCHVWVPSSSCLAYERRNTGSCQFQTVISKGFCWFYHSSAHPSKALTHLTIAYFWGNYTWNSLLVIFIIVKLPICSMHIVVVSLCWFHNPQWFLKKLLVAVSIAQWEGAHMACTGPWDGPQQQHQ